MEKKILCFKTDFLKEKEVGVEVGKEVTLKFFFFFLILFHFGLS